MEKFNSYSEKLAYLMTVHKKPTELALKINCSISSFHRYRRGETPLPVFMDRIDEMVAEAQSKEVGDSVKS